MASPHPDAAAEGTAIILGWERVHELTTEHGARIVVDLRRDRLAWMRLPALPADGLTNAGPRDGRWQRLRAIWQEGPIDDDPPMVPDGYQARLVVIGHPCVIAAGFAPAEWWTTSRVRRVRELTAAEAEDLSALRG